MDEKDDQSIDAVGRVSILLRARLSAYDGKATTYLGEAEAALSGQQGYLDALIILVSESRGHIASGASWLIKSALERGPPLSEAQTATLLDELGKATDWAVLLHICQSIRLLTVPAHAAEDAADWLKGLLHHQRPFLRAWSLDALGALAEQHPQYMRDFSLALNDAQQDEAASVRARARNLAAIE